MINFDPITARVESRHRPQGLFHPQGSFALLLLACPLQNISMPMNCLLPIASIACPTSFLTVGFFIANVVCMHVASSCMSLVYRALNLIVNGLNLFVQGSKDTGRTIRALFWWVLGYHFHPSHHQLSKQAYSPRGIFSCPGSSIPDLGHWVTGWLPHLDANSDFWDLRPFRHLLRVMSRQLPCYHSSVFGTIPQFFIHFDISNRTAC